MRIKIEEMEKEKKEINQQIKKKKIEKENIKVSPGWKILLIE